MHFAFLIMLCLSILLHCIKVCTVLHHKQKCALLYHHKFETALQRQIYSHRCNLFMVNFESYSLIERTKFSYNNLIFFHWTVITVCILINKCLCTEQQISRTFPPIFKYLYTAQLINPTFKSQRTRHQLHLAFLCIIICALDTK